MSSATFQSVPLQSTTLASSSPVAAISTGGRNFSSGTSQSREGYFSSSATASPSSTRRPSRIVSGYATPAGNTHQAHHSSTISSPPPPSKNRSHSLSTPATIAPAGQSTMSPGDSQRGLPPVISPRTSSSRAVFSGTTGDRPSRKNGRKETLNSPRVPTNGDEHVEKEKSKTHRSTSQKVSEDSVPGTPRTGRGYPPQGGANIDRLGDIRESKPSPVRRKAVASARNQTPTGPSREASEVLNRIIISQPEADLERERERMKEAMPVSQSTLVSAGSDIENAGRGTRSRQNHAASNSGKKEKNIKFGEYYLGGTLGEGEFGKVKMGWKQEGGVQVAIKLIRRDSVGTNPSRLTKIYREISILREISHPNIVRLHEMVETERQIGIILEYASGGELFDYILNHRYLKDQAARRLFAQLVSGVGYLHKKGIVHRDLKLENLLLDRNRNIIITDFGFANTFNAEDELGEEVEYNLSSREYVKRMELDKVQPDGRRRGDLMQTSCGSPCYAAPELVVSDALYTGRKVDVWSCGVILYAMLAGYLPFDDDPANPEGDNINLLYKYIVSTPLTFPEYVSPHARDLLRRILVPDPRKRADLFEVARHSWLAEYAHVVSFITSTAITNVTASAHISDAEHSDPPIIIRRASVRESSKSQKPSTVTRDISRRNGPTDQDSPGSHKKSKDNKRRTVQVEYVAPRSETQRGTRPQSTTPGSVQINSSKTKRTSSASQAPMQYASPKDQPRVNDKPLPYNLSRDQNYDRRPSTSSCHPSVHRPSRREAYLSSSDNPHPSTLSHPPVSAARPTTGGSLASSGSRPVSMHLTSRGSYSQPVAPSLAGTNVQGKMSQPKGSRSNRIPSNEVGVESGRASAGPSRFSKASGVSDGIVLPSSTPKDTKGHRRSNTIGGFLRSNSVFGGSKRTSEDRASKRYPPVSMSSAAMHKDDISRPSVDSSRSLSFGFGQKHSSSTTVSQNTTLLERPRRFSLLPTAFSLKAIGIGKDEPLIESNHHGKNLDSPTKQDEPPQTAPAYTTKNLKLIDPMAENSQQGPHELNAENENQNHQPSNSSGEQTQNWTLPQPRFGSTLDTRQDKVPESESPTTETNVNLSRNQSKEARRSTPIQPTPRTGNARAVLQKNNRRFADAYEKEMGNAYGASHSDHAGSSGAARKVMDFFRRRGRDRGL
ncbi:hypothetical protein K3495_g2411 [Podosphaera aphanis]|nr:hypothetical protein K3495_g2411 [Podosphaera aphanis]